jgi:ferritin-like metal-binding protein YciE
MADPTTRELKLIQYLNEAYGKEKELETALKAHISMTTRPPYKKRLQEHLRETKAQAKGLERRIKQLGGKADSGVVAEAADAVVSVAKKGVALAQGPLHAMRGTGEAEKMLKNAKTEYFNEAEEIANYTGIEALATALGDADTVKLAREFRRQEERMAKFLERLIPQLAKAVVQEEIPARERKPAPAAATSARRRAASSNGAAAARSGGSARSGAARAAGSAARGGSARATASAAQPASRSTRSASASGASRSRSRASASSPRRSGGSSSS